MLNPVVSLLVYFFEMLLSYLFFSRAAERRISSLRCCLIGLLCFEGAAAANLLFYKKSVSKTLKKYQGDFGWEYDSTNNRFITTLMLDPFPSERHCFFLKSARISRKTACQTKSPSSLVIPQVFKQPPGQKTSLPAFDLPT